jgi:hypothetical protein
MMSDAEIASLVQSFEDGSLPRSEWTHAKHFYVAAWYLWHHPRDEATRRMREALRAYARRNGRPEAYHETITLAWIALIGGFLPVRDREGPIAAVVEEILASCGDKDYLLRHYSRDVLLSEEARLGWVPPDKSPLPPDGALP